MSRQNSSRNYQVDGCPLFSIGIVCYRNWEFLTDAIDSVLSQDYPRIQLIISDDGSKGFPLQQFSDYIEDHKSDNIVEYTVRQSEKNEGTVRHLNRLIDKLHGEYIMFLAGDDMIDHDQVFTEYASAFETEGGSCMAVISQTAMYDKTMTKLQGYYAYPNTIDAINNCDESDELLKNLFFFPSIPTTTVVYRKKILDRFGPFDTSYYLIEDYPFFLKLAKEHVKMRFCNFVGARHRDGGISHGADNALSESKILFMKDCIRSREHVLELAKGMNVPYQYISFSKWQIRELSYSITTQGKGWKGKIKWFMHNPKDCMERLFRRLPQMSDVRLLFLLLFLLIFIIMPVRYIEAGFFALGIKTPHVFTYIFKYGVILATAFFEVLFILVNRFKYYDKGIGEKGTCR